MVSGLLSLSGSLSPLWGGCSIAGKLPSFLRFMWDSPSGGRKKVHSHRWFNSAKFNEGFISYRRCHLCGAAFPHRCSSDLLMWVRFRHLKLRWAGQIRLPLLTVGKTKLMILVNLHKRHVSSWISHISREKAACEYVFIADFGAAFAQTITANWRNRRNTQFNKPIKSWYW